MKKLLLFTLLLILCGNLWASKRTMQVTNKTKHPVEVIISPSNNIFFMMRKILKPQGREYFTLNPAITYTIEYAFLDAAAEGLWHKAIINATCRTIMFTNFGGKLQALQLGATEKSLAGRIKTIALMGLSLPLPLG